MWNTKMCLGAMPDFGNWGKENGDRSQMQRPDGNFRPDTGDFQSQSQSEISFSSLIMIGVSVLVLLLGIVFAFFYKRRK